MWRPRPHQLRSVAEEKHLQEIKAYWRLVIELHLFCMSVLMEYAACCGYMCRAVLIDVM